jgi:membrane protease YdiL (CAAX protease family)
MGLLTFLMVGFGEEAVYRSYVQNHIVDMLGNKFGLIISALIFMAVHLLTYGKVLDLVDVFLAGIILGYGFILTKSIYLPAAFHFMWDFLQVNIFRLQNYDYYKGPVLIIFNNTGDLIINNYNYGNKLEIIFIAVELLILVLMHIYKNKISSLKAS